MVAASGSALDLMEAATGVAVTGEAPKAIRARWLEGRQARSRASLRLRAAKYHGIYESCAPYGVRSAVTSRASRIRVLEPATRRQEASKFGQAFCEQLGPTAWISSRSPLARACGTLASTCGAKPGRTASAAATNAAIAKAESDLIMTVPCHWAFWPVVSLTV